MPDFTRAEISADTADLSAYRSFLKKLSPGQTVTLPLDEGETSRMVMRTMNAAAAQSGLRLARLSSAPGTVRVLSAERRPVTLRRHPGCPRSQAGGGGTCGAATAAHH